MREQLNEKNSQSKVKPMVQKFNNFYRMRKVVSEAQFQRNGSRDKRNSPMHGTDTPLAHLVNQAYFDDILN